MKQEQESRQTPLRRGLALFLRPRVQAGIHLMALFGVVVRWMTTRPGVDAKEELNSLALAGALLIFILLIGAAWGSQRLPRRWLLGWAGAVTGLLLAVATWWWTPDSGGPIPTSLMGTLVYVLPPLLILTSLAVILSWDPPYLLWIFPVPGLLVFGTLLHPSRVQNPFGFVWIDLALLGVGSLAVELAGRWGWSHSNHPIEALRRGLRGAARGQTWVVALGEDLGTTHQALRTAGAVRLDALDAGSGDSGASRRQDAHPWPPIASAWASRDIHIVLKEESTLTAESANRADWESFRAQLGADAPERDGCLGLLVCIRVDRLSEETKSWIDALASNLAAEASALDSVLGYPPTLVLMLEGAGSLAGSPGTAAIGVPARSSAWSAEFTLSNAERSVEAWFETCREHLVHSQAEGSLESATKTAVQAFHFFEQLRDSLENLVEICRVLADSRTPDRKVVLRISESSRTPQPRANHPSLDAALAELGLSPPVPGEVEGQTFPVADLNWLSSPNEGVGSP